MWRKAVPLGAGKILVRVGKKWKRVTQEVNARIQDIGIRRTKSRVQRGK